MTRNIKPVILKLGGSVVTDKAKPYSFNSGVVTRIAREILKANLKSLVIIHGGGSFGHPLAREYNLSSGFVKQSQLEGYVKTRQAMTTLNKLITDILIKEDLKIVSLQPSAFIITRNNRITAFETAVIERMLGLGLIPVLYGDIILDSVKGFTILSGDRIISKLACTIGSERVVLACDVDGVYTANPKVYSKAKLIRKITVSELEKKIEVDEEERIFDVTGLMRNKLEEMRYASKQNIPIVIVNGLKRERIYRALKGLNTIGTYITKK